MKIKNSIKKIIVGAALFASLYSPTFAQSNKPTVNLGYNAIENALTYNRAVEPTLRTRALLGADVSLNPVKIGYSGLHEINSFDLDTYYSRNNFNLGKTSSKNSLCAVVKIAGSEIADVKYGFRNTDLLNSLGADYGWIDATIDKEAGNITFFAGKTINEKSSIELYNSLEMEFKGKFSNYSELQFNHELSKNISTFLRAEFSNGNLKEGTYLVGLTLK